jgi:hypothetical protein
VLSIIPEFTEHVYLKVTRMLEDTKGVNRKKDTQYNGEREKVKMINNDTTHSCYKITTISYPLLSI